MGFFLLLAGLTVFPKKTNYYPKTNYHLIIDDHHIYNLEITNRGTSLSNYQEHLRSQIEILAYNPGYTFNKCLDTKANSFKVVPLPSQPKLYLYCGSFEYSFPAHFSSTKFSQAELWWLGQELSDFLNLELQVIYPTPKVPPAPSCGGGC
jgi:hypothetical protein